MGAVKGKVFIVGAGPGAADLITIRGLRAIRAAEVLLCDDLLPRSLLEDLGVPLAGRTVEWLGDGEGHKTQAEINELMSRAALAGKTVARLKNGDPFVFGRVVEEVEHLSRLGIQWDVIPGPSSCLVAPAVAGLPLTRRGAERSFAVTTARLAGGEVNENYPRADSLVVLMGASALEEVTDRLLREGWGPDAPVAVIDRATLPWERRVEGHLAEIVGMAKRASISSPAVLVVGGAALRRGAFLRPRILFTGLDPSNFRSLGDLLHWPALQVVEHSAGRQAFPGIIEEVCSGHYKWVVFTSPTGARSFFGALRERRHDGRILASTKVAVAGAGTAARVEEAGLLADAVPWEPGSPGILKSLGRGGGWVLVVQGSHAPRGLVSKLERHGWQVTLLSLHQVVPHPELGQPLPEHDIVYFVSPSGVRAFQDAYGGNGFRREVWCIGQTTLAELAKFDVHGKVVNPHGG